MTGEPLTFWTWTLASAAAIVVTLALVWRTRRFLAGAARAPGRIARVSQETTEQWRGQGQGTETVATFYAHVTFSLPDGSSVEFRAAGVNLPPPVGKTVTVAYDPARPEATARIDDGVVWRPVVISAMLTAVLVLFSVWTLGGDGWIRMVWETPIVVVYFVVVATIALLNTLIRGIPRGAGPRRVGLYVLAGAIGLYGCGAFFAQMLAAVDTLTRVIDPSIEWPVGSTARAWITAVAGLLAARYLGKDPRPKH